MAWYDTFVHIDDSGKSKNLKTPPVQEETPEASPKETGKTSFQKRFNPLPSLPQTPPPSSSNYSAESARTTINKTSGPVYDKFMEHFDSIFDGSNFPSPNYYLFSKMLSEMGDVGDQPKYRGAFAALKVQGLSKQSLIDSANQYINLLDADSKSFKDAVVKNRTENNAKMLDIKNAIQENTAAIDKVKRDTQDQIDKLKQYCETKVALLEDSIQKNQAAIDPLEGENQTINDRAEIYDNASQQYKNIIQSDIQKVQTIIQ